MGRSSRAKPLMQIDSTCWSGDGEFTRLLADALGSIPGIVALRIEDAPASRAESGYNFISNEIYVTFARRWLRTQLDMPRLEQALASREEIGAPDYSDQGMLQYLRTERVVAPYQRRGVKIVELVRIYETGSARRA
jgi:hypothetical protein